MCVNTRYINFTTGTYLFWGCTSGRVYVTLTWHVCKYKVHKLHQRYILILRMYLWWSLLTLTWHVCKYKVHKLHQRYILILRMYLWRSFCTLYLHVCQVSYCRWLRSLLLYLCYVFQALINSLVRWFYVKQSNANIFSFWTSRVITAFDVKQTNKTYRHIVEVSMLEWYTESPTKMLLFSFSFNTARMCMMKHSI